jgi:hypothetical protein
MIRSAGLVSLPFLGYCLRVKSYGQLLDSIEALPEDQQESLMDIVRKRLAERRRNALVKSVNEARKEFKSGKLRHATPAEIMRKILA